jgi:hypothetical protein
MSEVVVPLSGYLVWVAMLAIGWAFPNSNSGYGALALGIAGCLLWPLGTVAAWVPRGEGVPTEGLVLAGLVFAVVAVGAWLVRRRWVPRERELRDGRERFWAARRLALFAGVPAAIGSILMAGGAVARVLGVV